MLIVSLLRRAATLKKRRRAGIKVNADNTNLINVMTAPGIGSKSKT